MSGTIGVNTHYASPPPPAALAKLYAAGVRILRNDLTWQNIEKTRGVYDFEGSGFDGFVHAAENAGLKLLLILDYGNYLYGPTKAVVTDEGRDAFANFAQAAARRYGGRGHRWEIWNEPNSPNFWIGPRIRPDPEQYALLVQTAVAAIRSVDPKGEILAGAVFYGDIRNAEVFGAISGRVFLERFAATPAYRLIDGITAHFYRSERPESVRHDVTDLRTRLAALGRDKPVYSGEWGYSSYDPTVPDTGYNFVEAVTLEQQASYLVRMYLTNYLLGLPLSVYYQDHDPPIQSAGNIEDHWGLYLDDLSDKPAYRALATLRERIGDAGSRGTLALGRGEYGIEFETLPEKTTVLWAESEATWLIRPVSPNVRLFGLYGEERTLAGYETGQPTSVHLLADEGPIYLIGRARVESAPGSTSAEP